MLAAIMNNDSNSINTGRFPLEEIASSLDDASAILDEAVNGVGQPAGYIRQIYMRDQAGVVLETARDVSLLIRGNRLRSVLGLCRVAFEARIYLQAASRIPDFAAQKLLDQWAKNVVAIEALCKAPNAPRGAFLELERHKSILQEHRVEFDGVKERGWTFKEVAFAAGLFSQYERFYPLLSSVAHCTPMGLKVGRHEGLVAECSCNLVRDTIDTTACLVFHKDSTESLSKPITAAYPEIAPRLGPMVISQSQLSERIEALLRSA